MIMIMIRAIIVLCRCFIVCAMFATALIILIQIASGKDPTLFVFGGVALLLIDSLMK